MEGHEGLVDASGGLLTDPAAERLLLGGLMMKPAEMMQVSEYIGGPDFSDPYHRRLFEVIKRCFETDDPLTMEALIGGLGGDQKAMLAGVGLTAGQYVARLKAESDLSADLVEIANHLQSVSEHRAHSMASDGDLFDANLPFQSRFAAKMWTDQNEPGEQYEFLVEDLIPENEGVLVMGATQTGKSFLTYHLAMCGARGVPFFGHRIHKPFGTIWCAYEAARGATARMRAYRKHHGLDLDDLPFCVLTKPLALWPDPKAVDELVKEMKAIEQRKFSRADLRATRPVCKSRCIGTSRRMANETGGRTSPL